MARLYLVRRGLESFLGPMPVSELKTHWQRMAFGAQDEISGHCGPWITIENTSQLSKAYPEVAKALLDESGEGWKGNSGTRRIAIEPDAARVTAERRRTMALALLFLTIAVTAAATAVWLASSGASFSARSADAAPLPTTADVHVLLTKPDPEGLQALLAPREHELLLKMTRSREAFSEWIPYMRAYAFMRGGEIEGLSPKLLRGPGAMTAPTDCSTKAWRKRWRESTKQWSGVVSGRQLVRTHWSRLLLWDPHWIRRREVAGWIEPRNYHEACLGSALAALTEIKTERAALPGAEPMEIPEADYAAIKRRLQWLVEMSVLDEPLVAPPPPESGNFLASLTCIEAGGGSSCMTGVRAGELAAGYLDERLGWFQLKQAIRLAPAPDPSLQADLTARWSRLLAGDSHTRLDYLPELRLVAGDWKMNVELPPQDPERAAEQLDVKIAR